MTKIYPYLAAMLALTLGGSAMAAAENDAVNGNLQRMQAMQSRDSASVTYNFSDRSAGDKESTGQGATLSYSRALSGGVRDFFSLSGIADDYDSSLIFTEADTVAGSVSYGRILPVASGLTLTLGGFLSTTHTDTDVNPDLDINTHTAGVILGLKQSFPITPNIFGAVRATVLPRFTHKKQLTYNYDSVDYTATPGADLYYKISPDLFLGTGFETSFSNVDVTLSRKNILYRGGLGFMYTMNSYALNADYKREFAEGHNGNLFSVTISRRF